MRNWKIFLIIMLVVLVGAACGDSGDTSVDVDDAPATYVTLSVDAAYSQLAANDNAIIVDVRNPDEWAVSGVPPQSVLIPLPEFEARAPSELPQDQPIYVICNSGNRSRVASEALVRLGYRQVYSVDGGIQAWLRAGLPVEPYHP